MKAITATALMLLIGFLVWAEGDAVHWHNTVLALSKGSVIGPIDSQTKYNFESCCQDCCPSPFFVLWGPDILGVATVVVLIIQAVTFRKQAGITKKQNRILRRQTAIQAASQRPNIFLRTLQRTDIKSQPPIPETFIFQPVWKNTGQTSPVIFSAGASYQLRPDDDLPNDHDYSVARRRVNPIGRDMEHIMDPIFITSSEMLQCMRGEQHLFIWGSGEYTDEFFPDVVHCVEFCYRTTTVPNYVSFLPHGPYNRIYDKPRQSQGHHDTPGTP